MNNKLQQYLIEFEETSIPADPLWMVDTDALSQSEAEILDHVRQRLREARESLADVERAARIMLSHGWGGNAEAWLFGHIQRANDEAHVVYKSLFGNMCIDAFAHAKRELARQLRLRPVRSLVRRFLSERGEYTYIGDTGDATAGSTHSVLVELKYEGDGVVGADITPDKGETTPWVFIGGKWFDLWKALGRKGRGIRP